MPLIVLLAATFAALATPTPPPTIANTRTSPLCTAVREVIAPAVAGLSLQDRIIGHGTGMLQDMARMEVAGGKHWFDMDNLHLEHDVYKLAANNIKIHELLDQLNTLKLKDAQAAAELAPLRSNLQAIADGQAETLNVMSGTTFSISMAELANETNPLAGALRSDSGKSPPQEDPFGLAGIGMSDDSDQIVTQPAPVSAGGPPHPLPADVGFTHSSLFTATQAGNAAVQVALGERFLQSHESALLPSLLPIIDRCR